MNLFFINTAYASADTFIANVNKLIVNPLIGLMFAVALAYFLYGITEFLMNTENEEKRTAGKSHMLWGIIGLFIMFAVWGLLNLIINTFDLKGVHPDSNTVKGTVDDIVLPP
ncbi:MAG: hypothetical protein KBD52_02595 [Candidatus Pacebacteria bacterium]|nr:hypothetical protein [Candidatus Paceibacterota bacterium]